MEIHSTPLKGLLIISPSVFKDERGYFFESYRQDILKIHGFTDSFMQDNESKSQHGVLRGLHFQNPPFAQAKLVRVVRGGILDVVVDIRSSSETYGQHFSTNLSGETKQMLLIPAGFAHGFMTLEDDTIVNYKSSNVYNKKSEGTLLWNDKSLAIDWGENAPVLSDKDLHGEPFDSFNSLFD
jgi:dTDP-4-dehydrorhamnose 3,5-epimerase